MKHRTRAIRALLLAAAAVLLLLAGSQLDAEQPSAKRPIIPLAAIIPLTGNAADQGEWARRGFELALEEIQQSGKIDLPLTYEDSRGGDPAVAVQAYKSLALRGKPAAVFTFGSAVGMALTPLANADGVIQMGIATATPSYRTPNDFTFRNFPSAAQETDFVAAELIEKHRIKAAAVVNINSDYGVGTATAFKAAFIKHGGVVAAEESYNPGETDFKSLLLGLKQSNIAAIYLASYPSDGALLLKQARQLGLTARFVASVAIIGGKDFFSVADGAAEGMLVASSGFDQSSSFAKRYAQKYGSESPAQSIYVARAYDALKLVALAAGKCALPAAACLRDRLFEVRDYDGASGRISFDDCGDISTKFQLFRIAGETFVPAESSAGAVR